MQFHKRRVIVTLLHLLEQGRARGHMRDPIDENATAVRHQRGVGQSALLGNKGQVLEIAEATDLAARHPRAQHNYQWGEPIATARDDLIERHPASPVLESRPFIVGQFGTLCFRLAECAGEERKSRNQVATPIGEQGVRLQGGIAVFVHLAFKPLNGDLPAKA